MSVASVCAIHEPMVLDVRLRLLFRATSCFLAVFASGCGALGGESEDVRAVSREVVALIGGDKTIVCIDSGTRGAPLAVFRTMSSAPDPARRPLAWHAPTMLQSSQRFSGKQLLNAEFADVHPVIAKPGDQVGQLATLDQIQLNALASQMANDNYTRSAGLSGVVSRPNVKVRWWPINRFDRSCQRLYTVSDLAIANDTAFVSVTSGHWGTTYALRRVGSAWRPAAQWSTWLY